MSGRKKILMIAGAGESPKLARNLRAMPDVDLRIMMRNPSRTFDAIEGTRMVAAYPDPEATADMGLDAIIDVSAPFDIETSKDLQGTAGCAGVPYAQFQRPAWKR